MNTRKLAVVASVFFWCLATPLQAATYKINWLLGHKNLDYFEEAALEFKKAVEKGSNGDISVAIVLEADDNPVSVDFDAPKIAAQVAKGEAEMGHSFVDVMAGMDHRLYAFKAPYLFRGYRHQEAVFEGPLGAELLDGLRDHGLVGLSFTYSGGANGVATTDRELRRPEDLKGLKVGVFGDEVDVAWLKDLGATPVAIGHDERGTIAPLARAGKIDAVVITWRNFERANLNTEFRHVNMMHSSYLVSVTYINEKFFNGLPKEYRELITKATREAGRIERTKTIELNEHAKLEMLGKGVRPVHLSEKNRGLFVEALKPTYKNTIERVAGKKLIEKIRNTPDAPANPSMPADFASR